MKEGVKAQQAMMKDFDMDGIEDVMDDMRDLMAD